jgi:hypothetical protein
MPSLHQGIPYRQNQSGEFGIRSAGGMKINMGSHPTNAANLSNDWGPLHSIQGGSLASHSDPNHLVPNPDANALATASTAGLLVATSDSFATTIVARGGGRIWPRRQDPARRRRRRVKFAW